MPTNSSEGRRAAQASAAPMENDQAERDASLRKVEARDLVEFGMIPVRSIVNAVNLNQNLHLSGFLLSQLMCRNSLAASRF